eukprot:1260593-Prymnesium_polylepis.1
MMRWIQHYTEPSAAACGDCTHARCTHAFGACAASSRASERSWEVACAEEGDWENSPMWSSGRDRSPMRVSDSVAAPSWSTPEAKQHAAPAAAAASSASPSPSTIEQARRRAVLSPEEALAPEAPEAPTVLQATCALLERMVG